MLEDKRRLIEEYENNLKRLKEKEGGASEQYIQAISDMGTRLGRTVGKFRHSDEQKFAIAHLDPFNAEARGVRVPSVIPSATMATTDY